MQYSKDFKDYELLDMASGEKLEKWGDFILIRPDPQIVWNKKLKPELWKNANARYIRSNTGGGHWEMLKGLKKDWKIKYKNLTFNIKPMGFKHTGLFPEHAVNWDNMIDIIKEEKTKRKEDINVLNLFAYTGGATVACAYAGAKVCHVDSSKGMVSWAKENIASSGLEDRPVRFIVDDVIKFVKREIRRGNKYDIIIMDPPSYGRGANGEVWSIDKDLYNLVELCLEVLSDKPIMFAINTYTGGLSGTIIANLLTLAMQDKKPDLINKGKVVTDEIGIKMKDSNMVLPCGITTKWEI